MSAHRRVLSRLVSAVVTTGLVGASLVAGAGAAQAAPLMACQWIDSEYTATYDCTEPTEGLEYVDVVECWSMPVSERVYVSTKVTGSPWRKTRDLPVQTGTSKKCSEEYPYLSRFRIPIDLLASMETTRFRLTLPAAEGELPGGGTYAYRKTQVKYGVCLMPEDATDWCSRK